MAFSAVLLRPESEAFQLPVAASTACSSHPSPSPHPVPLVHLP